MPHCLLCFLVYIFSTKSSKGYSDRRPETPQWHPYISNSKNFTLTSVSIPRQLEKNTTSAMQTPQLHIPP